MSLNDVNISYREKYEYLRCFIQFSSDNPIYEKRDRLFIIKKQLLKTATSLNGLST